MGIRFLAPDDGDPHDDYRSDDSSRAHTTAPVHDGNETDNLAATIRKSDSDYRWLEARLIGIQFPDNGDQRDERSGNDSSRARTTAPVHDGNETDNWIPKALNFVSKKESSIPSIENHTLITLPITYQELEEESKKDSPKMTSTWTQVIPTLRLHKTSVIIQTSDHKVVCYKINSHYKDCANLNKLCVGLEKSWTATGKDLPQETKVTTRYLQTELVNKKVSGTFHFALWMERGHVKEGPLISAETLGANCSRRHSMVQGFLHGLKSLQERASTILKETYPVIHQQYSTFYQVIQDLCPSMSAIHKVATQVFVGCAVVVMRAVRPHRDKRDGGAVVMTVAGNFKDGDLIVGSNHYAVRLQYRPGDMVVMISHLVMHGIGPFTGQRRGLVLFSHREVMEWYNDRQRA